MKVIKSIVLSCALFFSIISYPISFLKAEENYSAIDIQKLQPSLQEKLDQIVVNRYNNDVQNAIMISKGIIGLDTNKIYKIENDKVGGPTLVEALNEKSKHPYQTDKPPIHATVKANTIEKEDISSSIGGEKGANILGGNGIFQMRKNADIPVIDATKESLAFYNALLIKPGDGFKFQSPHDAVPLIDMTIGENYVENYLSVPDLGGGEFVEHHDQPHLWMPQNKESHGHILLGRKVGDVFYFTGFKIPFGTAVYLSPGTLHADGYLIGDYSVMYTMAEKYSTYLIYDKDLSHLSRLHFSY